ncbi:CrcB family protein [Demequina sp.]|uniref:fluoride efflux transporter FluC n=1 Tax=Demequina sp. TaxID=2050685 RepID=UPI0025B91547|nr:CrcB family protein [Demequina sp.]
MIITLIAVFGGAGAAARFVVDGLIRARWSTALPLGTLTINISGSLLLGFLAGASHAGGWGGDVLDAAAIGFCGGYTTFSTAMAETVRFVQGGDYRRAVINALGTGVLTVAAAAVGYALASVLF